MVFGLLGNPAFGNYWELAVNHAVSISQPLTRQLKALNSDHSSAGALLIKSRQSSTIDTHKQNNQRNVECTLVRSDGSLNACKSRCLVRGINTTFLALVTTLLPSW